jgi:hypothetical protein
MTPANEASTPGPHLNAAIHFHDRAIYNFSHDWAVHSGVDTSGREFFAQHGETMRNVALRFSTWGNGFSTLYGVLPCNIVRLVARFDHMAIPLPR